MNEFLEAPANLGQRIVQPGEALGTHLHQANGSQARVHRLLPGFAAKNDAPNG
ncbi:MAG: hypothetical protein I8H88_05285 [Burkholderiales bacterium]|nr:hypothetical protein [Burkholderiales bacterium]